jgi:hypothetical protein
MSTTVTSISSPITTLSFFLREITIMLESPLPVYDDNTNDMNRSPRTRDESLARIQVTG